LHRRSYGRAVLSGRLERELPDRIARRLVEAVPGGRYHTRIGDMARVVHDDLEAHGRLESVAKRIRRVRRLGT
jgi:hypothetical protein